VAVLGGASPALFGLWRDRGLGVAPGHFPATCVTALEEAGVEGNLFHHLDHGGYVAWASPSRKTFIDGRLEVAGADWLARYAEAQEDPRAWERIRTSWNIEAVLVRHASPGGAAFLRALSGSGRWRLACLSPEAALLTGGSGAPKEDLLPGPADWKRILDEERGPEPGAGHALSFVAGPLDRLLRAARRGPGIDPVRRAARLANVCLTLGWIAEARAGYESILERSPADPEAWLNLGHCDLHEGRPDLARERWERALEIVGRDSRPALRAALERLAG
jgi:tetratricopeptide (TPR) repeat protein